MLPLNSGASPLEAGVDEAGRGCLAGPVFAAAVILPPDFFDDTLNDSKQISERRRNLLRQKIEAEALAWAVAAASPAEIDSINILNASILAMHRALDALAITPEAVAVDGNRFKTWRPEIPAATFVKGDARFANIAAASILAKTHRDEYMLRLHPQFPQYAWDRNKGYPTPAHRSAIATHGTTPHHRLSFTLISPQLTLF